ncbi:MAG: SUMF1/EgtB/PvdO family nonheme iron enzyme [Hyphomonadaceae bacterium]|nr:SUMF1/EgtB/PvdO family nonheme iron enzyme [Hyphomonadaceae bacterium]
MRRIAAGAAFMALLGVIAAALAQAPPASPPAPDRAPPPAAAPVAIPGQRIALVVGNGAYQVPNWVLRNPPNDATLIAARLRALQFDVDLVPDAGRGRFEQALARFGRRLRAGGNDTVAVFYYAGHAAQLDQLNYLVPTDALAYTSDDIIDQSPAMQMLFDAMRDAGNAVNIIVLDACRDVPLPPRDGARATPPSFNRRVNNVLISYATLEGTRAADGEGQANSPFTASLAEALRTRADQPIETLFAGLTYDLNRVTGGRQSSEFLYGISRVQGFRLAPSGQAMLRQNLPPPHAIPTAATLRDCASCPELVRIPAGRVTVGSPAGGRDNERPLRDAQIAAFAAGRFEVTRAEWAAFVAATNRPDPPADCQVLIDAAWSTGGDWRHPYIDQDDRHPAVCISWNDARDYVAWLSGSTGKRYRLLSETEWEYVARAGTRTTYPWGDRNDARYANSALSNVKGTLPVGYYRPNAFGLYDTSGNAAEWVQDFLSDRAIVGDGRAVDPCPPRAVSVCYSNTRMNRGGSWEADDNVLRVAYRNGNLATVRYAALGFRVARDLP